MSDESKTTGRAPLTYPAPLADGASVSLISPSSGAKLAAVRTAVESLQGRGFRVKTYRDFEEPTGYLAGDDHARAREFNAAFADVETAAVFAVRGGYGASRILDAIDYGALRRHPKPFVGYSDITALHVAIDHRVGLVTFHGPNAVDGFGGGARLDDPSVHSLWRALAGPPAAESALFERGVATLESLAGGLGEGRLLGGNLAVFAGLVGTPYEPDMRGRVLFLEDIGEPPYRIDRMLCQLKLAGKLRDLAAVLIGDFTDCESDGVTARQVLAEYLTPLGVPVVVGCPAGHAMPNYTIPHGAVVRVDGDRPAVDWLP